MSSNTEGVLFLPIQGEEESRVIFALAVVAAQIKIIRGRKRNNAIEIFARDVQIQAMEKIYKYIEENNSFDLWMDKKKDWFLSAETTGEAIFCIQSTSELIEEIHKKNPNNLFLKRILMETHFK